MTNQELPEPARKLWTEHGRALAARLARIGAHGWWLGGGTLLAADWRHRRSFDLDITISMRFPPRETRELMVSIRDEFLNSGLQVDDDVANRLLRAKTGAVDDYSHESGIDIWVHDPDLPGPRQAVQLDGVSVPRLSAAQILHGKLQRDRQGLVRDAYDISRARHEAGGALETAVNTITSAHQRRAELTYAARSEKMNLEPDTILDWNGSPAIDQRDCGLAAAHAIHEARWIALEIEARNGRVHAKSVNTAGQARHWLGPTGTEPSAAVTLLDEAGILLHLQNQYERPGWRVSDVVDRISDSGGRTERIVHTQLRTDETGRPPSAVFTADIAAARQRVGRPPGLRPPGQKMLSGAEIDHSSDVDVTRGDGDEAGGVSKRRDDTAQDQGNPGEHTSRR